MGKGVGERVAGLGSNSAVQGRTLTAVVAASLLAFASGCGSSPDDAEAAGGSGSGGGGGAPSAAGAGSESGGSMIAGGSAGSGGSTTSMGGVGGSGGDSQAGGGSGGDSQAGGGSGGDAQAGGGSGGDAQAGGGSGGSTASSTFKIQIDYKFDSTGAFTPERRAVIEAAARAWERLILSEFDDVPMGTAIRTRDPEHFMDPGIVFPAPFTIDDLAVFVGFAAIDGQGMTRARSSFSFTGEVADPVLLTKLDARFYDLPFQPWVGNTTFDLAENWFYDPTPDTDTDLSASQSDFMTTALHELGHLLGIGNSAAWDSYVIDNHFTGPHAVALNGGPVLVSADLNHIDASLLTNGIRDLMASSTANGQRLRPGALDLAILEDLGYTVKH